MSPRSVPVLQRTADALFGPALAPAWAASRTRSAPTPFTASAHASS